MQCNSSDDRPIGGEIMDSKKLENNLSSFRKNLMDLSRVGSGAEKGSTSPVNEAGPFVMALIPIKGCLSGFN